MDPKENFLQFCKPEDTRVFGNKTNTVENIVISTKMKLIVVLERERDRERETIKI